MFRLESYVTPIIRSYFSKYVKNTDMKDFEVSFWDGDANFSNLELNLDVLDRELQLPLTFASGHVQGLMIKVPWRSITSEPIVLNVKSMELVLNCRDPNSEKGKKKSQEIKRVEPATNTSAQTSGYVQMLIAKIINNVRVNFENVVIKYQESDISFSVNVGEASLTPADENWNHTFLHQILYAPDFVLRKKLSFSDVNICLDRCNNNGIVHRYHEPMMYRCDFDVRIIQKFATPNSRVPYFYRMDLFLGHLQFCVTNEQIPMLVRMYHLFTWLMQSGTTVDSMSEKEPDENEQNGELKTDKSSEESSKEIIPATEGESWASWATGLWYQLPEVFGDPEEPPDILDDEAGVGDADSISVSSPPKIEEILPAHGQREPSSSDEEELVTLVEVEPEQGVAASSPTKKVEDGFRPPCPATTHFGIYIKTLTIILRAVQRSCDRPSMRRNITISPDNKFLKCSIQGIVCNFILRGNENSHSFGVSSIMVHGLGFCPCGVQDCSSTEGGGSSQGGECYFEAGQIKQDFAASSLFPEESDGQPLTEWCYDVNHKDSLTSSAETALLEKTPAFFMKYVVIMKESTVIPATDNKPRSLLNAEILEIIYHGVAAPSKVLICSGLLHRLKMINEAINTYDYNPYDTQSALNLPDSRFGVSPNGPQCPVTTYRLVIRQPLIEILVADHPCDYGPEKRAEYFRKSGGIVKVTTTPRLKPEWPRMLISCDILELTAEDSDGHFDRLRRRVMGQYSLEEVRSRLKRIDAVREDELMKPGKSRESKTAMVYLSVKEVLVTFVSEPVELDVGIKSASFQLDFLNSHFYTPHDSVHRIQGGSYLETLTCSTRLEHRSNILWLPFTPKMTVSCDWEPSLRSPSIEAVIDITALFLYIGPETIITFSQLSEKLLVYLQEFLPSTAAQTSDVINEPKSVRRLKYNHAFKKESQKSWVLHGSSDHPDSPLAVDVCLKSNTVMWKFPQKRMLYGLTFHMQDVDRYDDVLSFEIEYYEQCTNSFYPYHKARVATDDIYEKGFYQNTRYCTAAEVWRITLHHPHGEVVLGTPPVECFTKSLFLESAVVPECNVTMKLPEVMINLVNNTHYAGRGIRNSVLQKYANTNTDIVSPSDHVIASLQCKLSLLCYSAIDDMSRLSANSRMSIKVLDYEQLVLDEVMDEVYLGAVITYTDNLLLGPPSAHIVTNEVNLKMGASLMHTLTYSTAMWNQIINSFDIKQCKMMPAEDRTKIILNRVLVCNELDLNIKLHFPYKEGIQPETVESNDCKAWCCPGRPLELANKYYFTLSDDPSTMFEIDIGKLGYTVLNSGMGSVFVNVLSLSESQRMIKISGPLVIANGLDKAIIMGLFTNHPYHPPEEQVLVPGKGTTPSLLWPENKYHRLSIRYLDYESEENEKVYLDNIIRNAEASNGVCSEVYRLPLNAPVKQGANQENPLPDWVQVYITLIIEYMQGSPRYLITVAPEYCIRSWLCNETLLHLGAEQDVEKDVFVAKGKGEINQIDLKGRKGLIPLFQTRYLQFQSNPDVPPSTKTVALSPAQKQVLVDPTTQVQPIDAIIAQITAQGSEGTLVNSSKPRWPFVSEEIDKCEWNTEINPETEILVCLSPWIEGLPTAVLNIRPWGLFVNLSGVELLFAQETAGDEWEQYWVPYKCVFSPKRIAVPSGKFRLGVMMNDFLVKSKPLEFSDQPERLSVKKINKDCKVPIECYSRLDLFGGSQLACLTIETRVQNGMLVVIVRPTYSIQNRTTFEVYAEGVTISSPVTQRRESWTDNKLSSYSILEASRDDPSTIDTAVPILHFVTDGQDYSVNTTYYKYLALSIGGPWWFVQLVDCTEVNREQKATDGIPGTKVAVTLPKVDCKILSPPLRHQLKNLSIASEAVVVGSYTQNGQVWISVSQDNAPQVYIHNKSTLPFFCVEKDGKKDIPHTSTTWFQQFLMVPPETSCQFSFQSAYHSFPQLNKREKPLPDMLMAFVSQDLIDLVTSNEVHGLTSVLDRPRQLLASSRNSKIPSGNLLFPEFEIEWKNVQSVQHYPTQLLSFGRKCVKLTVECVGYTYHVFIENTRLKQVSAKSIRSRVGDDNSKRHSKRGLLNVPNQTQGIFNHRLEGSLSRVPADIPSKQGSEAETEGESDGGPPTPPLMMVQKENKRKRSWIFKMYIPELYISLQDNFIVSSSHEREFLGLSFEALYLSQFPISEDSVLRPAECSTKESWVYGLRIGNFQIDTPRVSQEERLEFLVLVEPKKRIFINKNLIPTSAFSIPRFMETFERSPTLNLDCTLTLIRVSEDEINLDTAWLKVLPSSVFIEDRLLTYILPSVQRIGNVLNEGYGLVEQTNVTSTTGGVPNEITVDCGTITHLSITDDQSSGVVSSFYSDKELPFAGGSTKKTRSAAESSSLFSRNISFAPTVASSSSGLNSSSASMISSTMSNLRLASVSPPPPSPMVPLEPHGSSLKWPFDALCNSTKDDKNEDGGNEVLTTKRVKVPQELLHLFAQLSRPVRLSAIKIEPTEVELTLHTEKVVYVALDRSVVVLKGFQAYDSVTTDFHLGLELTMHYTMGTIFTIGNPVRVLGSLELLGSPGTLARTVGTGLRDLVVYPYEGFLTGPVGFVSGLGFGMSSFLQSVTSGSLQSITNWAASMSRNVDRWTLDKEEQAMIEGARLVELQGFRDGLVQGLSGCGIRLLGAIGGLSHHTIQNVVDGRPSTSGLLGGVGRGMFGVIVKPVGGFAELIAMTGQGILLATGWKPKPLAIKAKKKQSKSKEVDIEKGGASSDLESS
ncbi:Vacuolar protein sorting-associated protein 13B [Orchesella cincta]|uniref:Vacuolar protein sorting-associated protein 13B n=1 Tax=Orchesella cincta TaxID=48709 RepID=A0A1D2NFU8_ORCCI|nr:Vacuolar protein sorting-associated protein 13B [Orchesella cincta]